MSAKEGHLDYTSQVLRTSATLVVRSTDLDHQAYEDFDVANCTQYPRLTLRACANDSELFTFNNGTNEEQDAYYFYEVSKYVPTPDLEGLCQ